MFICIHDDFIAFFIFHVYRYNFFCETVCGKRFFCTLLTFICKCILFFTTNIKTFGYVFSSLGHCIRSIHALQFWVRKSPADCCIKHLLIASRIIYFWFAHDKRCTCHTFRTTCYKNITFTTLNGTSCKMYSIHP